MKLIRKQARKIALLLSITLMFVSCSQYDDNANNPIGNEIAKGVENNKLSGEELFKSIIFADGVLTKSIPALSSLSKIETYTAEQLNQYRTDQAEAILFLKNIDANYFAKFKQNLSSKDVELISLTISKVTQDLVPFINQKLAIHGLSVDKIVNKMNKDGIGEIENQNDAQLSLALVWVVGLAVVAVVVIILSVAVTADTPAYKLNNSKGLTLETLSIQIAEKV